MHKMTFSIMTAMMLVAGAGMSAHAAMPKAVTVKGELLDMACYSTMQMKGRAHGKTCGKKCLASGLPAGILVKGKAWTLLTNPGPLAAYVGKTIKVTGKMDSDDDTIFPLKIWWKMGDMWMAVKLRDQLHR